MFADWVTAGVGFGIKAFFAVLTLATTIGAILGIIGMIAALVGGDDESKD